MLIAEGRKAIVCSEEKLYYRGTEEPCVVLWTQEEIWKKRHERVIPKRTRRIWMKMSFMSGMGSDEMGSRLFVEMKMCKKEGSRDRM